MTNWEKANEIIYEYGSNISGLNLLSQLEIFLEEDFLHFEKEDKVKLAIIMIEELTGYKYMKDSHWHIFHKKDGGCDEYISYGPLHEWVRYMSPQEERLALYNDWLPYLHLAGDVFRKNG